MKNSVLFLVFFLCVQLGASKPNYVFDLSGSLQGYGDITGPLWTLLGIKKQKPHANYGVILDARSENIFRELYGADLPEIARELGVTFYNDRHLEAVPVADVSFELFFGGRKVKHYEGYRDFVDPIYCDKNTITIISDTMHGMTLDEVVGPGFELYFKPPGIGKDRSGILDSPDLAKIANLPNGTQRLVASALFKEQGLKNLLLERGNLKQVKLSFLYGAHNETFDKALIGQTVDFIRELGRAYPETPVVIFAPEPMDKLREVLPGFQRILTVADLSKQQHLEKAVYVLQLPKITSFQFTALLASADLPVLLEGNSAVSTAIRLYKDFVMYRSSWNAPQIQNLVDIDRLSQAWIYSDVYDLGAKSKPNFQYYFGKTAARKMWARYDLSRYTPDFPKKLVQVLDIAEALAHQKHIDMSKINDEYLKYSLVKASKGNLEKIRREFPNWQQIEARTVPNRPNFSEKMEVLAQNPDNLLKIRDYLSKHKVYISLTTSPKRISEILPTLKTLDLSLIENILLVLPERFGRDNSTYEIPQKVAQFPKMKILRIQKDLGPITKLLPAIEHVNHSDPDAIVISIDDDMGYNPHTFRELVKIAILQNAVTTGSGFDLSFYRMDRNLGWPERAVPKPECHSTEISACDGVEGFGAIAYKAKFVNVSLMKRLSQIDKTCFRSDDIVISYVLALSHIPRLLIRNEMVNLPNMLPHGFGADALHKDTGNSTIVENAHYTNYPICYQKMVHEMAR